MKTLTMQFLNESQKAVSLSIESPKRYVRRGSHYSSNERADRKRCLYFKRRSTRFQKRRSNRRAKCNRIYDLKMKVLPLRCEGLF